MTAHVFAITDHPAGWRLIRAQGEVSADDLREALADDLDSPFAQPWLLDVSQVTAVDTQLRQWWDRSPDRAAADPLLIAVATPDAAEAVAARLAHAPVPWPVELMTDTASTVAWQAGMTVALGAALEAFQRDEVPVGACLTTDEDIEAVAPHDVDVLGVAGNAREASQDPLAHAEYLAIRATRESLTSWRFIDTTLYVTLEPCPMCAGMILQARIPRVVFGALDPKAGAMGSLYRLHDDPRLNHRVAVAAERWGETCSGLLREFFRRKRLLGKK